jgi:hypothetical protein
MGFDAFVRCMNKVHDRYKLTHITAGGARGPDEWAIHWAKENKIDFEEVRPDWTAHGRAAGYKRNVEMIKRGPDLVVAFFSTPKSVGEEGHSRGTSHTVFEAERRGITTIRYYAVYDFEGYITNPQKLGIV